MATFNLDSVPEGIRSNEIFQAMIKPVTASPAGCLLSGGGNAAKIVLAVQELEAKYIATFQTVRAKFPNVYNAVAVDSPEKADKLKELMRTLLGYENGAWDVYMLETLFLLCKNWVDAQQPPNGGGGAASASKTMTMSKFKQNLFEVPDTTATAGYWRGTPLGDAFTLFEGLKPCINIDKAGEPEGEESSIFCEICSAKKKLNSPFNVANIRTHAASQEHMTALAAHRRGAALMWYAFNDYSEEAGPPTIIVPPLEEVETVPDFAKKFKGRKRSRSMGSQSKSQTITLAGGRSQERTEDESEELPDHGLSGTAPVELLKNVERLRAAGFHSLADAIREEGIIGEYNIPLFYGAGNCIRSVFCHWKSSTEAGPCCECLSIANNRALQQLAIRTGERYLQYHNKEVNGQALVPTDFSRVDANTMGLVELRRRVEAAVVAADRTKKQKSRLQHRLMDANAKIVELATAADEGHPSFINNFIKAYDDGIFEDKGALEKLLSDISTNILRKPRGHRYNATSQALYLSILNYAGPRVHQLVSNVLQGPTLRQAQNWRQKAFHYELGWSGMSPAIAHAAQIFERAGYKDIPCIVAEDSTALQAGVQPEVNGKKCYIYGFCGGAVEVSSVQELMDLAKKTAIGTSLYVYTLIPMALNAPTIVVGAVVHDSSNDTLSREVIERAWKQLHQASREHGINLFGHASDGDSRLRAADLDLGLGVAQEGDIVVAHPLIEMCMRKFSEECKWPAMATQDWLHIIFRLRVIFLRPDKKLMIGTHVIDLRHLSNWQKKFKQDLKLLHGYLSYKDKQNYAACLALADLHQKEIGGKKVVLVRGVDSELPSLRAAMKQVPEYWGTYLYLEFLHRYTRAFVMNNSPEQCIKDAGFCIMFLGRWHQSLLDQPRRSQDGSPPMVILKKNFLTMQSFKDSLISLNALVLMVVALRRFSQETGRKVQWVPSYLSSRFVEYTFSFLRALPGSVITALSAKQYLHILDCQMEQELFTEIGHISGKRLAPQEQIGINSGGNWMAAADLPNEEMIIQYLDIGSKEADDLLKTPVRIDGSTSCVFDKISPSSQAAGELPLLKLTSKKRTTLRNTGGRIIRPASGTLDEQEYDVDEVVEEAAGVDTAPGDESSRLNIERFASVLADVEPFLTVEDAPKYFAAIRVESRRMSAVFQKMPKDRASGRFYGPQLQEHLNIFDSKDDPGYLSDEDTVAVLFDDGDRRGARIDIGVAEGFVKKTGKGGKGGWVTAHEVSINDPDAKINRIHWFEGEESTIAAPKRQRFSTQKRVENLLPAKYKLNADPKESLNYEVKMEAVLTPVILRYNPETYDYTLDADDHRALNEYLAKYQKGEDCQVQPKERKERRAAKSQRR